MPRELALDPGRRGLYGAMLRPPPGYVFDTVVATTYSLNFETALAVPLGLTAGVPERREEALASPLALLEGLERNADHADILRATPEPLADPWAAMFAAARASTVSDSDLVPYWIYEGPTQVERRVLAPPFSREISRLAWLKRSVAVYRLAFGQPRQDDLLAWLEKLGETLPEAELARLQIRLAPEPLSPLAPVVADRVAGWQASGG